MSFLRDNSPSSSKEVNGVDIKGSSHPYISYVTSQEERKPPCFHIVLGSPRWLSSEYIPPDFPQAVAHSW